MVKKFVYRLLQNGTTEDATTEEVLKPCRAMCENLQLFKELARIKNEITHYHRKERKWERFKKLANDYELIHSSCGHALPSIASVKPISRSYFKLHEILVDMQLETPPDGPCTAAFLADAPGGFVQAFVDYRKHSSLSQQCLKDRLFAVSLSPRSSYVPSWKLSSTYCADNNIRIFGAHPYSSHLSTGDLTDPNVVDDFIDFVGNKHTCNIVTADGGFDFSADFNDQESKASELIAAEVAAALQLQAPGGSFVLKIFDISCVNTFTVLHILFNSYEAVYLHKPLTSRPANSEKYLVCTGFKMSPSEVNAILPHLWKLSQSGSSVTGHRGSSRRNNKLSQICCCSSNTEMDISSSVVLLPIPDAFIRSVYEFNSVYVAQQAFAIVRTIAFIDKDIQQKEPSIIHTQLRKAIRWCHKYNIPIDVNALKSYNPILMQLPPASEDFCQDSVKFRVTEEQN